MGLRSPFRVGAESLERVFDEGIGTEIRSGANERNRKMGVRSLSPGSHEQWLQVARNSSYCVDAAARQCGISSRQLFRIFVADMGCSPKKWFKRRQLELGHAVLMRTGCVKIAAYECGYSQVANFCRDFKKEFGCPAGQLLGLRFPVGSFASGSKSPVSQD